jgi:hypothetical protein
MKPTPILSLPCLLLVISCAPPAGPAPDIDAGLAADIDRIRAVDNHAHPLRLLGPGESADAEWDALPIEGMEPAPLPWRVRPENPEVIAAWRALYGYRYDEMAEAHVRDIREAKSRLMRDKGDAYPSWVLDQIGIGTMVANRVVMGRGLAPPRFLWVSYVDALMVPLGNGAARRASPDYRVFYAGEENLLKRYLSESKLKALPPTLDEYLSRVVTPTLERHRRAGALAVKFEAAYLRSLDFTLAPKSAAAAVYRRYARGGEPPAADYKALQDYLFRTIAGEAGTLGLAVHIHVGEGAGGYFNFSGSNPMLLEPVLNDPALRRTNFVLIHGGWPFAQQTTALLAKPNVYADFSEQAFILYPRELSRTLRAWLEFMPEKVLFGTDCYPVSAELSWEETAWLANRTVRRALALALTGMMNDGEISRERALELAGMVLRENAVRLYGLEIR